MDKRETRFDGWKINFDSGEISRHGSTHRLQDQPLQILEELLRRPGEVVTREQLIARLWPTGVVEFDTGLNSAVRKLRVALGDDADTPRYIETLPRKGYRFIAALEPEAMAATPAATPTVPSLPALPEHYVPTSFETGAVIGRRASDRRAPVKRLAWGFSSILVAAALALIAWQMPGGWFQSAQPPENLPTIVVLPLVDMSVDQHEQALCDGLTEELSNWLAHIPTLRVVARTSAFAFKGKDEDVREIGRKLGATHALEGSLRRSGDQLRITVQLITTATGLHLWSKSFDLPIGDIFMIEDTVSRAVAEALHLELTPDIAEKWAQRQPEKMEAYELYLLGRARQAKRTAVDNVKAAEFFRRSIAADPGYALAHVGLAETLLNDLSLNRAPLEDVSAEVEPMINQALALNPKLPEAIAVQGWLLNEQFKTDEALVVLKRAIAANPNDASSFRFLGNAYDRRADPEEALKHFSVATSLDPLDFISHVFRCMELTDLGEFDRARADCEQARNLEPKNLWGPLATSWISHAQGDTLDELKWVNAAHELSPMDPSVADRKMDILITLGKIDEARAVLHALPADETFFTLSREANLVFAAGGAAALKAWLGQHDITSIAQTSADLADLVRIQLLANDGAAARATIAHAQHRLPMFGIDLYDGSQIRYEYSVALIHAAVELNGGDRDRAMKLLAGLDRMLDTYESNGGRHYGLYLLRADSLSLQGKKAEAAAALQIAWKRGWRATWHARREPYLTGVEIPGPK
jgi:TolB-like protein/DNA-binding winged helix-turn-helix (wHTH) protein/Tfp pilus assembly protein PilF